MFLELRPVLLRRVRAMGARNDAEDVLQDVWLRLRAQTVPISNPEAYLYRMAYTVMLDRRRSERRSAARDGAWSSHAAPPETGDAINADAERQVIARETLLAVAARLEALGDPAAAIFRRHRIGGETQRAIALDLGMGLSTVEKHLRRAYAVLLDLEGEYEA